MDWNIAPEFISLVFISILIVYSREYNLVPTLKNRIFRLGLWFIFIQVALSIASIMAIENYQIIPRTANHIIQLLFFLSVPGLAFIFLVYVIAVIWENDPQVSKYFLISSVPYFIYAVLVLTNPTTKLIYTIDEFGFIASNGFLIVYAVSSLFLLTIIFIILLKRTQLEKSLMLVLLSFPIISLVLVVIQWFFPYLILSGSAATASLLILYLYLQNKQIFIDNLTELQNRRAFSRILEFYVKRKRQIDIILISLDNFKEINDSFGQRNGDLFLKAVSKYLAEIVPIKFIFRYSGDEFIIILEKELRLTPVDVVRIIQKGLGENWEVNDCESMLKASISIVSYPEHANTVKEIISVLEYGIGLSKRTGKGKTIFSNHHTINAIKRHKDITELMKKGLSEDVFDIYYQPIYSVACAKFTSAEALLRLTHSELGSISPTEFIPIAEQMGISTDITFLVLDKVCQFIKELDEKRIEFDIISFNMSNTPLNLDGLSKKILNILNENEVNPKKLQIEITESVFVDNLKTVSAVLNELRESGIQFSLDDFGTGYSNIANMAGLPVDCIKIDKSLIYKSINDMKCFTIVAGLSKIFSEVGMKIVVEGVETAEHRTLSEQLNVDYIQGFMFAKPMPATEAIHFLGKGLG